MPRPNRSQHLREKTATAPRQVTVQDYLDLAAADKVASQAASIHQTALQVSKTCVPSDPSTEKAASSGTADSTKLAQAAAVIDRLLATVQDLRASHDRVTKFAAGMVEATKQAVSGLLDVEDILPQAKAIAESGAAKVADVGDLYEESPGQVLAGAEDGTEDNELTSFFRSRRSR